MRLVVSRMVKKKGLFVEVPNQPEKKSSDAWLYDVHPNYHFRIRRSSEKAKLEEHRRASYLMLLSMKPNDLVVLRSSEAVACSEVGRCGMSAIK